MKKFVLKLSVLIVLLAIIDGALGIVFKLYDFTKGGEISKVHSIMTKEEPDMVILGSSRACHHFDPQIFTDSTKMNVYNAGIDGMGATVAYGFLNGFKQRKNPQIILFELTPDFDIFEGFPVSLDIFYPYIDNKKIEKTIVDFDNSEKWKLKSNAYRLNSVIFRLIPSILLSREIHKDGYIPLSGKLQNINEKKRIGNKSIRNIDPLKKEYFYKFLDEAKQNGTYVFASISPAYGNINHQTYAEEIRIVEDYGIPVFNHLTDTIFIKNSSYFQDKVHLNKDGATLYSKVIANEINNYLKGD